MGKPRLVVVDNGANGKSKVTKDFRPAPFFVTATGNTITELWFAEKDTTQSSAPSDIQKAFSLNLEPGAKRFIQAVVPPFSKENLYAKKHGFSIDKSSLMHNTTTIDFAVVLKGKIKLLTENGSVTLSAGDCVVQKATVHGWINPGKVPCEIIFVMIGVDVPRSYKEIHGASKIPVSFDYPKRKSR